MTPAIFNADISSASSADASAGSASCTAFSAAASGAVATASPRASAFPARKRNSAREDTTPVIRPLPSAAARWRKPRRSIRPIAT